MNVVIVWRRPSETVRDESEDWGVLSELSAERRIRSERRSVDIQRAAFGPELELAGNEGS